MVCISAKLEYFWLYLTALFSGCVIEIGQRVNAFALVRAALCFWAKLINGPCGAVKQVALFHSAFGAFNVSHMQQIWQSLSVSQIGCSTNATFNKIKSHWKEKRLQNASI